MMRIVMKILHTLAAAGLIGGLLAHMTLLVFAPQDTAQSYADLRAGLSAISDYLIIPSLAVGLVTGLLAMAVHRPYLDKGWVLIKALLGLLMLKGVLGLVGAKSTAAASVAAKVAAGELPASAIDKAVGQEWMMLWVIFAVSLANIVLGVWRPRLIRLSSRPASQGGQAG